MGKFFGDKDTFKSMTAWGVMLIALGGAMIEAGGDTGMLTSEGVRIGGMVISALGTLLTGFGARRAIGKSNPSVIAE